MKAKRNTPVLSLAALTAFVVLAFSMAAPAIAESSGWQAFKDAIFSNSAMERDTIIVRTQEGEEFVFDVELAVTRGQQETGLMHRTSMGEEEGMLFLFDMVKPRSFWMKDTLIPLDILFLNQNGEINHIHQMAKPQDMTHITSPWPSKAVLEINGGLSDRLGIEAGDKVHHDFFDNVHLP